jgi:hypothetical protein
MDPEQVKEWQNLRASALETLRNGYPQPNGARKILRLLVLPSFSSSLCTELFHLKNEQNEFILFQSQWKLESDLAKFRTPIERLKYPRQLLPSIETFSKAASPEFAEKVVDELSSTNLPLWIKTPKNGLDGTEFELKLGGHYWSLCYHWWEQLPPEWKALDAIINTVMEYAKNLFKT